jgi:hypothetical protein
MRAALTLTGWHSCIHCSVDVRVHFWCVDENWRSVARQHCNVLCVDGSGSKNLVCCLARSIRMASSNCHVVCLSLGILRPVFDLQPIPQCSSSRHLRVGIYFHASGIRAVSEDRILRCISRVWRTCASAWSCLGSTSFLSFGDTSIQRTAHAPSSIHEDFCVGCFFGLC